MGTNWPIVRVEDVCSLIVDCVNKTAPVSFHPTNFRMIRTTNVRNGKINLSDCKYVDEETYKKWTRRARLEAGDVILTREAPIGEVGQIPKQDGLFLGQRLMQYRADPEKLDDRFLLYSFLSPQLQHQFGSHEGSGSVVSHIRVGDCFKFEMRLPPLVVQKRIGEILGSLDEKINLNRRINQTLEAMAQAIFKSWFVDFDPVKAKIAAIEQGQDPLRAAMRAISGKTDTELDQMPREHHDQLATAAALFPDTMQESELGEIPKGWGVNTLGGVTDYLNRGISPKYLENGGVLVLNQKCIRDFRLDESKGRRHDPSQRKIDGRTLEVGDVLVNSTGVGTLGRVAQVLHLSEPAIVDSHVTVIRSGSDINHSYLGCYINWIQPDIEAMGEGSTGQTELSRLKLADFPMLMPHKDVLKAFDSLISPLKAEISAKERESVKLAELRDTLLPKLLSGELSVSPVTDHTMP